MRLLDSLLSLIFPPSEEIAALERLSPAEFYERAAKNARPLPPGTHAIFSYRCPLVRQTIVAIKYEGNRKVARLLAHIVHAVLLEKIACENIANAILIPLPSSKQRRKERGWSQTEMLAAALEKIDSNKHFLVRHTILEKIKHTESQTRLSEDKRRQNLKGCFAVNIKYIDSVKNKNIILLDDVTTTGSTFLEASDVLRAAGAQNVMCFAVAH